MPLPPGTGVHGATLQVEGLADLQRALKQASDDVRLGMRRELRGIAEPVQQVAEQRALAEIRNVSLSPEWAEMRIGVTRNMVYVAPRKRGVKTTGRYWQRRPGFADLLMERAMKPALEQNADNAARTFQQVLDTAADKFNED